MAKYSYKALGAAGKSTEGVVESSSREGAIALLQKQGLKPLTVVEGSGKSSEINLSFLKKGGSKVKTKDLVVFTRQLSTMISAGVPLNRSLATMQSQSENKAFAEVIGKISKDVEGGSSLASAFGKYPKIFSDVYVNMMKAGEAAGIMDQIMGRLATQVEKDSSIRKKIKSASAYPMVLLFITFFAFFGMMTFVVPKLGKILTDLGGPNAELPALTTALLGMSSFVKSNAILIVVLLVGSIFGFKTYTKTPAGKYNLHRLLLKTPVLKTVITKIAIARFARTFASLMSAGVSVLDALEVTGGAIGNKVIEKELHDAAVEVRGGKQLSEPLSRSKIFPAIVAQMLSVGEETGQVDTILLKVADFYEEEVDAVIEGLSSILEPILIVVMGAGVGVLAVAIMGPIAKLSTSVGG
jgi:type IV pilus assembly protein PilC